MSKRARANGEPGARAERRVEEGHIRVVRVGHGANCSSIGSVIDTLFVGALAGGVIFAAIAAALRRESVTVVGGGGSDRDPDVDPSTSTPTPTPTAKPDDP